MRTGEGYRPSGTSEALPPISAEDAAGPDAPLRAEPRNAMTPEKAAALRAPFPPESIGKLPKAGITLDYVGHAAVTDRLLAVDPSWTWEPMALASPGVPAVDSEGNLWIRLTVCGVTRLGVGDGRNMKERIGDALRNAAMRFGVALDLWAKEPLHLENGGSQPEQTFTVAATKKALVDRFTKAGASAPADEAKDLWAAMVPDGVTEVSMDLWDKLDRAADDIIEAAK